VKVLLQRGEEEMSIELKQDIAMAEYLVVSQSPDGSPVTERFGGQAEALAYIKFLEERLRTEQWSSAPSHRKPEAGLRVIARTTSPEPEEDAEGESEPSSTSPSTLDADEAAASYSLERPVYCPHCREWIRSIHVVRLVRRQVRFTSTLPRGGRVLACSACSGVLSVELSGLI
jgi:hypothetical protein